MPSHVATCAHILKIHHSTMKITINFLPYVLFVLSCIFRIIYVWEYAHMPAIKNRTVLEQQVLAD